MWIRWSHIYSKGGYVHSVEEVCTPVTNLALAIFALKSYNLPCILSWLIYQYIMHTLSCYTLLRKSHNCVYPDKFLKKKNHTAKIYSHHIHISDLQKETTLQSTKLTCTEVWYYSTYGLAPVDIYGQYVLHTNSLMQVALAVCVSWV